MLSIYIVFSLNCVQCVNCNQLWIVSYFRVGVSSMCILCCSLYFMSIISFTGTSSVCVYIYAYFCVIVCVCVCVFVFVCVGDYLLCFLVCYLLCAFSACVIRIVLLYVCARACLNCVRLRLFVYIMLFLRVYVFSLI